MKFVCAERQGRVGFHRIDQFQAVFSFVKVAVMEDIGRSLAMMFIVSSMLMF